MSTKFSSKRALTEAEELEIQRMIASDLENPELTDDQIAEAKPFAEVFPELMESIRRARGRPKLEAAKEAVTLRVTPETLARFKAAGPDWRARMSKALDKAEP